MVFEQGPRICNVSRKDVCMIENDKGVKYVAMLQYCNCCIGSRTQGAKSIWAARQVVSLTASP